MAPKREVRWFIGGEGDHGFKMYPRCAKKYTITRGKKKKIQTGFALT